MESSFSCIWNVSLQRLLRPGGPREPLAYIIISAVIYHQKMNQMNISHSEKGPNSTGGLKIKPINDINGAGRLRQRRAGTLKLNTEQTTTEHGGEQPIQRPDKASLKSYNQSFLPAHKTPGSQFQRQLLASHKRHRAPLTS